MCRGQSGPHAFAKLYSRPRDHGLTRARKTRSRRVPLDSRAWAANRVWAPVGTAAAVLQGVVEGQTGTRNACCRVVGRVVGQEGSTGRRSPTGGLRGARRCNGGRQDTLSGLCGWQLGVRRLRNAAAIHSLTTAITACVGGPCAETALVGGGQRRRT